MSNMALFLMICLISPQMAFGEGNVASEEKEPKVGTFFREKKLELEKIRNEIAEWDQAVLGFRKEHHFSLSLGSVRGYWHFKRFGSQVNEMHDANGQFAKFSYSYHIPIFKSFGYYLGSSSGVWLSQKTKDVGFQSGTMLPGVLAGLCINFSPGFRLMGGIDYYLERWSRLQERDQEGDDPKISVTSRSTDLMIAADFFYRLKWAVRFEVHKRDVDYTPVKKAAGKGVDASISRIDEWYGLGLTYHLM